MPSLSSTYLLPAILLNPAFILHLLNTFFSHLLPPPPTESVSPHPFMESLGPLPGADPYIDMHADDQLCWRYTAIMVLVQLVAFGRVQGNRVVRKRVKAEREQMRKDKLERFEEQRRVLGGGDGTCDIAQIAECDKIVGMNGNGSVSGAAKSMNGKLSVHGMANGKMETDTEESTTEASEEEMFI